MADEGTSLTIDIQVRVWHPYPGEVLPREMATKAMYEIQDGVKSVVEKHGLAYAGCGYGLRGKR